MEANVVSEVQPLNKIAEMERSVEQWRALFETAKTDLVQLVRTTDVSEASIDLLFEDIFSKRHHMRQGEIRLGLARQAEHGDLSDIDG